MLKQKPNNTLELQVPKFDDMNETDVREMIVRPLLVRLGYEHGTPHNIRTEQTFRYAKAFLGRKNAKNDPLLTGRADYILEVVGVGRWVVEVKAPKEDLSQDVVEQAHTYAAHPEVAALFFLVTNGRENRLYRTSSLTQPLLTWEWADIEEIFLALQNLVGPEAIQRKMKLLEADKGKPLAKGVSSNARIVGGYVRYEDHVSNLPLFQADHINGVELPVTGGEAKRQDDGRIYAVVKLARSAQIVGELAQLLGRDDVFEFHTSADYISTDSAAPTIFQNIFDRTIPAGAEFMIAGLGKMQMPFGFRCVASTEAIGFVEGEIFKGTMQLRYEFYFEAIPSGIRMAIEQRYGRFPAVPTAQGGGIFEVQLLS